MRVMIITNLYPPAIMGGYELRCSWVAQALRARGHAVTVVTSCYGEKSNCKKTDIVDGITVNRILHESILVNRAGSKRKALHRIIHHCQDVTAMLKLARSFKPDIINYWNLGGIGKGILGIPKELCVPAVYCVDDVWMKALGDDAQGDSMGWDVFWAGKWGPRYLPYVAPCITGLLRWYAKRKGICFTLNGLKADTACFISEFQKHENKNTRIRFGNSLVIHGGVSPSQYFNRRDWTAVRNSIEPMSLLYCGAITASRRLDTLLDAIDLMSDSEQKRFRLSIVGRPHDKQYYEEQVQRVKQSRLCQSVSLMGWLDHADMASIYAAHDVLVFTSALPEGLPLTVIEAMMSGCCVVTTGSGGAAELALMADQPLFPIDCPQYLRTQLLKLERNRALLADIAAHGQTVAMEHFTIDRMTDEFEQALHLTVASVKNGSIR